MADLFAEDDGRPAGPALMVDLDGFEGPLDLLLALARTRKLDLAHMSMLALAEQYLAFIEHAETLRLEVAADYLVMAAWLAYLKSRLLLPKEPEESTEPSGEELAAMLAFRLQRLAAMREASARIMARPQLNRAVFERGMPEGIRVVRESTYTATVYDLLKAYADQRKRTIRGTVTIRPRVVWSIKEARQRLEKLIGQALEWSALDGFLERTLLQSELGPTVVASSFGATLEMAREGHIELRQTEAFGTIYIRARRPAGPVPVT